MIVGLSLSHGSGIPEVEQEKQRQIVSSRDDNGLEKSGMLWWDNLVSVYFIKVRYCIQKTFFLSSKTSPVM